jgi:hypothetical protein
MQHLFFALKNKKQGAYMLSYTQYPKEAKEKCRRQIA